MELETLTAQLEADSGGKIAFACSDLESGARLEHRADVRVPTASIIKLPILVHVALAVEEGQLSWDQELGLTAAAKVAGSGILKELSAGLRLSVRDLAALMIALSDNTATNMLIDLVGIAAVNERLGALGYSQTRLFRLAYTPDTPESLPFGLGATSASEMVDMLARLARKNLGGATVDETVLHFLAMQQDRAGIPRLLPEDWTFAGKSGAVSSLRNDVGLLTAPDGRRFALAIFCNQLPSVDWSPDNAGLLAIAKLAAALVTREPSDKMTK